jgi:hypothetical protein
LVSFALVSLSPFFFLSFFFSFFFLVFFIFVLFLLNLLSWVQNKKNVLLLLFYITLSFFSSFTLVNFLLPGILFILLPQLLKKWIVPICFMFFLKYLKSPPY